MKKSLKIMLFVATMIFVGACDPLDINIEIPSDKAAHCKRYHNSYYDANTKMCYITVEKPVKLDQPFNHPETSESLSKIFTSCNGGKPKCTVHRKLVSKPNTEPFVQRVIATCDGLNLDITFTDSINEFSKKALTKAANDAKVCSRYANANACDYKYLDKYCMRDWNKPLECKITVSKPVKHPENSTNLSRIFKEKCEVTGWKLLDLNDRTKQRIFAICNDTKVNIVFEHVMTEKEIAYDECKSRCKYIYNSFPVFSLAEFDGTCICQGEDDEYAKLDNINNKKMSMLQSMIHTKQL